VRADHAVAERLADHLAPGVLRGRRPVRGAGSQARRFSKARLFLRASKRFSFNLLRPQR
jgi:hypothetical protein